MRNLLFAVFGFLLLATALGLARPERLSHGAAADQPHSVAFIPDTLCGEGAGHGACQFGVVDQAPSSILAVSSTSSRFGIAPVFGAGRSLGPHIPPPRYVS